MSSLLRVERHISHKTRQKSSAEVRRAMRVGSKEDGAGPGAIEAGQSQEGTGGGTGQWHLHGGGSGGSSAFLRRCGR